MKPHDQLTFLRNRHRARELREFRDLVEMYFAQSERDVNDVPMDWEAARAARARINQMLPRILQIVHAAGLGPAAAVGNTDPGPMVGRAEVLQDIFTARFTEGLEQEILDVIDMALGVYESGRYTALARTFNPLYYAGSILSFVTRGPRRFFRAIFLGRSSRHLGAADLARLESVASRLNGVEERIDARLAAFQDRSSIRQADYSRQLAELAERLDFAERVLATRREPDRLPAPSESDTPTPA